MARLNVNPTRMELTRLRNAYVTAMRGHKLLKDKRDELMRQLINRGRAAKRLRKSVEKQLSNVIRDFRTATAAMGMEEMRTALLNTLPPLELDITQKKIMSVPVPEFKTEEEIKADISWGVVHTSAYLDSAAEKIPELMADMLRLAELEKSLELIAGELERVRRRVNALEHIMLPEYLETIKYITMKLEENERASSIRLLKVKELVLLENRK